MERRQRPQPCPCGADWAVANDSVFQRQTAHWRISAGRPSRLRNPPAAAEDHCNCSDLVFDFIPQCRCLTDIQAVNLRAFLAKLIQCKEPSLFSGKCDPRAYWFNQHWWFSPVRSDRLAPIVPLLTRIFGARRREHQFAVGIEQCRSWRRRHNHDHRESCHEARDFACSQINAPSIVEACKDYRVLVPKEELPSVPLDPTIWSRRAR